MESCSRSRRRPWADRARPSALNVNVLIILKQTPESSGAYSCSPLNRSVLFKRSPKHLFFLFLERGDGLRRTDNGDLFQVLCFVRLPSEEHRLLFFYIFPQTENYFSRTVLLRVWQLFFILFAVARVKYVSVLSYLVKSRRKSNMWTLFGTCGIFFFKGSSRLLPRLYRGLLQITEH